MSTSTIAVYRLDPALIHLLRFSLEGYEGVALLTTLDSRRGLVRLHIAPGCEDVVGGLLRELAPELHLEPHRESLEI
ncbi:MAG: DUF4911 domain-containing protein [Pseudomonadota bacterium]